VFENIIRNAAEIMEESGELKIITGAGCENGDRAVVNVRFEDTGPGISEEHLAHIFDPFFTTKMKGHGTGLGLALSRGIVERHRGSLTATNRNGGGAVFTVRIPAFHDTEE
jgi:signal transduction histidine kinase